MVDSLADFQFSFSISLYFGPFEIRIWKVRVSTMNNNLFFYNIILPSGMCLRYFKNIRIAESAINILLDDALIRKLYDHVKLIELIVKERWIESFILDKGNILYFIQIY